MAPIIRMERLSKTFGRGRKRVQAVTDVSLEIAPHQVYGFLGPNGAGKTTTIRMLLDLIRPTQGLALLFGENPRQRHALLHRVGALVEGAAFYPYLSGRANLVVLARTFGTYDARRIDALLEQVGLTERADQRFNGYSLGMKQRLGLAAALLHDPELLILDEPTNGLDPAGITEMRTFIRELADKHGKTVFLSSHLLNEVEQVCDRIAIIHKGRILREGAVSDLLSAEQAYVRVDAEPADAARAALAPRWQVEANGSGLRAAAAARADVPALLEALRAADVTVYGIMPEKQSLEEYFLSVTEER